MNKFELNEKIKLFDKLLNELYDNYHDKDCWFLTWLIGTLDSLIILFSNYEVKNGKEN